MEKIVDIANKINLDNIELYGNYKAKINYNYENNNKNGKLILVT